MKSLLMTLSCALLAACAGQSERPAAPAATPVAASTTTPPATVAVVDSKRVEAAIAADPTLTPAKIHELEREGYTLTIRQGTAVFCSSDVKTGTRLARDNVCQTAAQIEQNRAATQQSFGDAARAAGQRFGN